MGINKEDKDLFGEFIGKLKDDDDLSVMVKVFDLVIDHISCDLDAREYGFIEWGELAYFTKEYNDRKREVCTFSKLKQLKGLLGLELYGIRLSENGVDIKGVIENRG